MKKIINDLFKNNNKRCVGRPKMADEELITDAKKTMHFAIITCAFFLLTGITVLSGQNPTQLLKISTASKLSGSTWNVNSEVLTLNCSNYNVPITYTISNKNTTSQYGNIITEKDKSSMRINKQRHKLIYTAPKGSKITKAQIVISDDKNEICRKSVDLTDYTSEVSIILTINDKKKLNVNGILTYVDKKGNISNKSSY